MGIRLSLRRLSWSAAMSVASLLAPAFGQTPPEEVLGFKPGEDFHLATYEQAMEYFDRLAGESDRMRMFDMGPTSAGRRMRYAVISSEANMANLDRFREIAGSLSLARGVSAEQAEQLAEEGSSTWPQTFPNSRASPSSGSTSVRRADHDRATG